MKVRIVSNYIIFSFTFCTLLIITCYIKTNISNILNELTVFKIIIFSFKDNSVHSIEKSRWCLNGHKKGVSDLVYGYQMLCQARKKNFFTLEIYSVGVEQYIPIWIVSYLQLFPALPTVCRPVAKVDRLLDALQNHSAVNCFKNSMTKVILCLKA